MVPPETGHGKARGEGPLSRHVSGERLWDRLMELARFGATADGGVDRQALSEAEIEARRAVLDWGRQLGLTPFDDAAGNLFLRLEGRDPSAAPVVTGSHIDSQPTGGKFDGAFGFCAALEVMAAVRQWGRQPRRPIEAVAWMNEEGSRFSPGFMGSEAFTGRRPLADILAVRDAEGICVAEALPRLLAVDRGVASRPFGLPIAAYLEAHIEQGRQLQDRGKTIGVVTGMQGARRFRLRIHGEAAHAGTTPRAERKDALMAAMRIINALDRFYAAPDVMFTVGLLRIEPNVQSIVPREAYFSVDLRHRDNTILTRLGDTIRLICDSEKGPCRYEASELSWARSLDFPEVIQGRIADAAGRLGLSSMPIYSAAGHDARNLHYVCPTGMIFIPCRDGISHNVAEWAEPEHVAAGARVLADTVWELADG